MGASIRLKSLPTSNSVAGQIWKYPDPIYLLPVIYVDVLPCFPSLELERACFSNNRYSQTIKGKGKG